MTDVDDALEQVGPRLRAVREQRAATLAQVSEASGISVSTLSRLESGQRRPTLELLLRLARVHEVPVDALIHGSPTEDPRVRAEPVRRPGRVMMPLTRRPGGVQAYKMVIDPSREVPEQRSHEGYEWMYVLNGRLRLLLAELDLQLAPGEAAEFDTHTPHWFGSADRRPVEVLILFGPQGERMHVRAAPRRRVGGG
ncbi:helix-turn-helix domain-containing protein [Jatrophihabitans endophyticus]|uniref:helix-turn-helix domain-containing protein n=1 Tax=Jatrophihabitans endophyticus TaxID=1206085 RepID=UPI0019E2C1F0|nr:XRE family transcriptional regulator [Jatrophihabitans endophyticus]MBE7187008.1 helix-turn-helix domain-containing protein [Jatrophihabitans endophyticus]